VKKKGISVGTGGLVETGGVSDGGNGCERRGIGWKEQGEGQKGDRWGDRRRRIKA